MADFEVEMAVGAAEELAGVLLALLLPDFDLFWPDLSEEVPLSSLLDFRLVTALADAVGVLISRDFWCCCSFLNEISESLSEESELVSKVSRRFWSLDFETGSDAADGVAVVGFFFCNKTAVAAALFPMGSESSSSSSSEG